MSRCLSKIFLITFAAVSAVYASEFQPLVKGSSTEGWAGAIDGFTFKDGVVTCKEGAGGSVYTKKQYANFVVRLEFKLPDGGNNGLVIRYPGYGDPAYSGMCEIQVLDDSSAKYSKLDPRQYHGCAYGIVAAKRGHLKPVGEWNKQTVTVNGSTIHVVLNGEVILDTDLSKITEFMEDEKHPGKDRTSGHFGFAGHKSPVSFRNIEIKELPDAD